MSWDKIAPSWNKLRTRPLKFVEHFLKHKTGKILDVGCGTGRHFPLIKGEIFGLDSSKTMLAIAQEKFPKAKLFLTSMKEMPFKENYFDAIIAIASLHCLSTNHKKALSEFFRVLKPGKQALISTWSPNHPRVKKTGKITIPWQKIEREYYIFSLDNLKNLLLSVGFKIISIKDDSKNIIAIVQKPSR